MKTTTLFLGLAAVVATSLCSCNEDEGLIVGLANLSQEEIDRSKVEISIDDVSVDSVKFSLKPSDNCIAYTYALVPEPDTSKITELYLFKNENYRRCLRDNFMTPSEKPVAIVRAKKDDSSKKYCVCALSYFHPDSDAVLSYALVVDLNKPKVVSSSANSAGVTLVLNKKIKSVNMSKVSISQYAVNSGVSTKVSLPSSASIGGESVSFNLPTVSGAYYVVSLAKGALVDFQGNVNEEVVSSVSNGVFSGIYSRRSVTSLSIPFSLTCSGFFNQVIGNAAYSSYFTTDNFKIVASADRALYPGDGHCVVPASNKEYDLIADFAPGSKTCTFTLPVMPIGACFNEVKFTSGCFEDEYGNRLSQSGGSTLYVDSKISFFVVTRGSSQSQSKYAKFYGIYKASVKSYLGNSTNVGGVARDIYVAVCESTSGTMYVNLVGLFQSSAYNGLAVYRVFGENLRGTIDGSTIEMKNNNWFGSSYNISPGKTFYVRGYKGTSAKNDSDLLPISSLSSIIFTLGNGTMTLRNGIGLWGYDLNESSSDGYWFERYDGNLVFSRVAE